MDSFDSLKIADSATCKEFSSNASLTNRGEYGFRYRKVNTKLTVEEQLSQTNTVAYNAIFLQLEGELMISWGRHKEVTIKGGDIYFLPRGATVTASILSGSISYVVIRLEPNIDFGSTYNSRDKIEEREYSFRPLPMVDQLILFAESIKDYLTKGVNLQQLYSIKLTELRLILDQYYHSTQCALLFYPLVAFNSAFEKLVLSNYQSISSVEDLADMANMSRSTFDRKFKECFDTTPLKWIERQTRRKIMQKACEPNVSVKDLMYEVDIYNPSQFTKLCKRLCGATPSQLLRAK